MLKVLTASELTKQYAGVLALDRLDLSIGEGSIHGLIGPNGSGKTTFINLVSGIVPPTAGQILFKGKDITQLPAKDVTKRGISRTFQQARVMERMSCLENVMAGRYPRTSLNILGTYLRPPFTSSRQEKRIEKEAQDLLAFVGLETFAERPAGDLVWVQRQLLQIARGLATEPSLLLLDEPTAGMGETESGDVQLIVERIRQSGVTILLVSHDVKLVARLCDYVTVINFGEKVAEGPPAEVQQDPAVIEAYLGAESD